MPKVCYCTMNGIAPADCGDCQGYMWKSKIQRSYPLTNKSKVSKEFVNGTTKLAYKSMPVHISLTKKKEKKIQGGLDD